jgi:small subunit ribosomal protein S6
MRKYEVMVILDPDLDDRSIAPSLEQFLKVIRDNGGNIEKTDIWGRRRLAYEIKTSSGKKVAEGIYAVVDLSASPDAVKEFDRQANLSEAVIRTKVIRPDQR